MGRAAKPLMRHPPWPGPCRELSSGHGWLNFPKDPFLGDAAPREKQELRLALGKLAQWHMEAMSSP